MTDFDWSRYRQCTVCAAGLGKPCLRLSGFDADGPVAVVADRPHGGRKQRTGAVNHA